MKNPDMLDHPPEASPTGRLLTPKLDAFLAQPLPRPARNAAPEPSIVRQVPQNDACGHDLLVQCLFPVSLPLDNGHSASRR